eukprot:1378224-Amphidinium_carterae.1
MRGFLRTGSTGWFQKTSAQSPEVRTASNSWTCLHLGGAASKINWACDVKEGLAIWLGDEAVYHSVCLKLWATEHHGAHFVLT